MNAADIDFLLGPGAHWLDGLQFSEHDHLRLAMRLREHLTPDQVHAVLETARLRERATAKFSHADRMFFVRAALEQASGETIAAYRADRFSRLGVSRVADLGCGIGGDAIGLAAHAHVVAVDQQPLRLRMARANAAAYGRAHRFHPLQADITVFPPLPVDAFFFDPARRTAAGRRLFSVSDYRPSPAAILDRWRPIVPHAGVKISPGVDYGELPPADTAEAEFISVDGDVKECVLWYGGLHSGPARRATLLPDGHTLTTDDPAPAEIPQAAVGAYLYEPDGAVIRAHLIAQLAHRLNAAQIDPHIAYLTADEAHDTPFARRFAVRHARPFQLKELRHYLRQTGIGRVVVKKRGSPLDPDELRKRLRLRGGGEAAILFLTQQAGEPIVIVATEER